MMVCFYNQSGKIFGIGCVYEDDDLFANIVHFAMWTVPEIDEELKDKRKKTDGKIEKAFFYWHYA